MKKESFWKITEQDKIPKSFSNVWIGSYLLSYILGLSKWAGLLWVVLSWFIIFYFVKGVILLFRR